MNNITIYTVLHFITINIIIHFGKNIFADLSLLNLINVKVS